jgi:REP element-mobilizing transposase RayT
MGFGALNVKQAFGLRSFMSYHERRLPHAQPPGATYFLTWRLFGSLPKAIAKDLAAEAPGRAFAIQDRLYDTTTRGARWLQDERVAAIVAAVIEKGAYEYRIYELHAWTIMPNHVHVVMRPVRPLPEVMRWIKGSSARAANLLLNRTGHPFWRYETYDHFIRDSEELARTIRYVERNPVCAGLVSRVEDWRWSSAHAGRRPTLLVCGPALD